MRSNGLYHYILEYRLWSCIFLLILPCLLYFHSTASPAHPPSTVGMPPAAVQPVNGVIYMLTKMDRQEGLRRTLRMLHQHFNCRYQYPVIILADKDSDDDLQHWLHTTLYTLPCQQQTQHHQQIGTQLDTTYTHSATYHYNVTLHQVNLLQLPPWLTVADIGERSETCEYDGNQYRYMCRYQAMLAQNEPFLQQYDYYMRLDDDSFIHNDITYDLFSYIHTRGIQYGFTAVGIEMPNCVVDLRADILQWGTEHSHLLPGSASNNVEHTALYHWPPLWYAYNNFEIGSLHFFRSHRVKQLLDTLDRSNKQWKHRWGDAPIRTYVAMLLLPSHEIHYFNDLNYSHNAKHERWVGLTENDALHVAQQLGFSRSVDECVYTCADNRDPTNGLWMHTE